MKKKWNITMLMAMYTMVAFVIYFINALIVSEQSFALGIYLFTLPTLFVAIKLFSISSPSMRFFLLFYLLLVYVLSLFLARSGHVAPWESVAFIDLLFLFSFLFNQEEKDTPLALPSLWKYHLFIIFFATGAGVISFMIGQGELHALFVVASLLTPTVLMVTLMVFVSTIIKTTAVSVVLRTYKFFLQGGKISRLIFADEQMLSQERFELSEVVTEPGLEQNIFFTKVDRLNSQSAESDEFQNALKQKTVFSYDFGDTILAIATVKTFSSTEEYRFSEDLKMPDTTQKGMSFVALAERGVVIGYYAVEKIDSAEAWKQLKLIRDGLHKEILFTDGCKRAQKEGYPLVTIDSFDYRRGDVVISFSPLELPSTVVVAGVAGFKEGSDIYFGTPFVDTVLRLIAVTDTVPSLLFRAFLYTFIPISLNIWILFLGLALPQMGGIVLLLSFAVALLYIFSGKRVAEVAQR